MKLDIDLTVHFPGNEEVIRYLRVILKEQRDMAKTMAELEVILADHNTKLEKISGETTQLLTEIDELKTMLEAGAMTTPEVDAQLEKMLGTAQGIDDKVTDLAPPAP